MNYIVYQQRAKLPPTRISNHRTQGEAIEAASRLLCQWKETGANPPSVFACYNGARSVEVWRDGVSFSMARAAITKAKGQA